MGRKKVGFFNNLRDIRVQRTAIAVSFFFFYFLRPSFSFPSWVLLVPPHTPGQPVAAPDACGDKINVVSRVRAHLGVSKSPGAQGVPGPLLLDPAVYPRQSRVESCVSQDLVHGQGAPAAGGASTTWGT